MIAIGIPIVVSVQGLLQSNNDVEEISPEMKNLIVATKDVDKVVSDSAERLFQLIFKAFRHK